MAVNDLRRHLYSLPEGPVEEKAEIERLLKGCWGEFAGPDGGMSAGKLAGRMEDVRWHLPVLTFRIARHGGTAHGSKREQIQEWTIDLEAISRNFKTPTYRQLRQQQARVDTRSIADQIAQLIQSRQESDCVKWLDKNSQEVVVHIGMIFPDSSDSRATVTGRRKRFWKALDELLAGEWSRKGQKYSSSPTQASEADAP